MNISPISRQLPTALAGRTAVEVGKGGGTLQQPVGLATRQLTSLWAGELCSAEPQLVSAHSPTRLQSAGNKTLPLQYMYIGGRVWID